MIKYELPINWIRYSLVEIASELVEAKAVILSLQDTPYERGWIENLLEMELKREVAGTSRIEGADFTEEEFEDAVQESGEELITRSQRQARAAMRTYKWIATIPNDRPVDLSLMCEMHAMIVRDADDDHCCPGVLRKQDENVTFGQPRHRGADGGVECEEAFSGLVSSIQTTFREHDPLIQALAVHYHLAAMHPFLDGNGRTARALEALFMQRAGLRDFCFIAMSNYYYDEKQSYLSALADVRSSAHDLTSLLKFSLKGIAVQSRRVLRGIRQEVSKALYRNMMHNLFGRLKSPKKRVIAHRQLAILENLLKHGKLDSPELTRNVMQHYEGLKEPIKAIFRDVSGLIDLEAIQYERNETGEILFSVRIDWPTRITETRFFDVIKKMPRAKTLRF